MNDVDMLITGYLLVKVPLAKAISISLFSGKLILSKE